MNEIFLRVKLEQLVEDLKERYKCELCSQLMVDPIQTMRGYSACERCYKEAERDDGTCPIDQEPITTPFQTFYFNDRAKKKEMSNLQCYCINKVAGCGWNGTVKEFEEHRLICEFTRQLCPFCNIAVTKDDELEHFKTCSGINKVGDCIFKSIGCLFKAENENNMVEHMEGSNTYHLFLQSKHMQKLEEESLAVSKQLKNQVDSFSNKERQYQTDITEMGLVIETLKNSLHNFQSDMKAQLEELQKNGSSSPNRQPHRGAPAAATGNSELDVDKKGLEKITRQNKEISNIVTKSIGSINELDLRLQLHENTTYDGKVVWKIDKVSFRRNQAITGKITALHSAPCYAEQYGYKFCARLYLNGDGMGRGTHLSLFIVLMKSEYDSLLEWPFQKAVQMTLINQRNQVHNVVEKLLPHKDSSSFQKPKKDMNIASGCPMFVRIDRLEKEGFVVDDSMFIEVKVGE